MIVSEIILMRFDGDRKSFHMTLLVIGKAGSVRLILLIGDGGLDRDEFGEVGVKT